MASIKGIEASRGAAAILVVIYHLSRFFKNDTGTLPFGKVTEIGHIGVDFFFVLSGFIIYYVHHTDFGSPAKLKGYFEKRVTRIYPVYWVVLAIAIPFTLLSSAPFPNWEHVVAQTFLFPTEKKNLLISVAWTLQLEVLFYALFAILIFSPKIGGIFALFYFLLNIIDNYFIQLAPSTSVLFSSYVIQFFFGCAAGYVVTQYKKINGPLMLFLGCVLLFVASALELSGLFNGYTSPARLYYGVIFAIIIASLPYCEKWIAEWTPEILLRLGRASYSIYLTHIIFGGVYFKLAKTINLHEIISSPASALLVISLTTYTSIVFSEKIEFPVNAAIRKWVKKKRAN